GVASSAYYCGDPYDGVYATRNQISTYLHHRKWSQNFTPTVGPLAFAPYVPAGKENDPSSRRIVFRWADLLADLNYIASRFDDYSA
nr:hypothetical protein [Bacilli bacterium]